MINSSVSIMYNVVFNGVMIVCLRKVNSNWQLEMNYFDWIKFSCYCPNIENWYGLNWLFKYKSVQTNGKIKTKPIEVGEKLVLKTILKNFNSNLKQFMNI